MILMIKRVGIEGEVSREFIEDNSIEYIGELLMPEQKKNLIQFGNTYIAYETLKQLGKKKILKEIERIVGFKCEIKLVENDEIGVGVIVKKMPKYILDTSGKRTYKLLEYGGIIESWEKSSYKLDEVKAIIKDYELVGSFEVR